VRLFDLLVALAPYFYAGAFLERPLLKKEPVSRPNPHKAFFTLKLWLSGKTSDFFAM